MTRRSRAREVALQVLYQADMNPSVTDERDRARFLKGRLRSAGLVDFAAALVSGVEAHRAAIDERLENRAEHWRVSRMAATDRAVLRIAFYELLHTETPGPVIVDEAIELARRYGNDASPRFVAGILGRFLADRAGGGTPAAEAS